MHFASYNVDNSFSLPSLLRQESFRLGVDERAENLLTSSFHHADSPDARDSGDDLTLASCAREQRCDAETDSHTHRCGSGCQRVVINVSGLRFETQRRTLNRLPHTLLGDPEKRKRFWDSRKMEYFLDRHRPSFQAILYYYQSGGKLKRPLEVPRDVFLSELQFYELGEGVVEAFKRQERFLNVEKLQLPSNKWSRIVWRTFEDPSSSWYATCLMIFSVAIIGTSVVAFCMETLPQYQRKICYKSNSTHLSNTTHTPGDFVGNTTIDSGGPEEKGSGGSQSLTHVSLYSGPFFIIDAICVSWFTVEFFVRLCVCPSKKKFLLSPMNIVDLVAVVPFYVTLIVGLLSISCVDDSGSSMFMVIRVVRVVRIFKLGKHSQALQVLGKTITSSLSELSLFALFLTIAIVLFSAAMYHAEHEGNPEFFTSIPHSFWYTIVTMTTVGYGDAVPIGIAGKLIGSACVLAGVLVIALPVPVIVTNFSNYYQHATGRGVLVAR